MHEYCFGKVVHQSKYKALICFGFHKLLPWMSVSVGII